MSTIKIPQIHIKHVPTSPLFPLDVERRDSYLESHGYEVLFEGTIIGIIDAAIASKQSILRWHDVIPTQSNKKQKTTHHLHNHEKSLTLLEKCLSHTNSTSKPAYFQDPFRHGCDSIEELAMIGGDDFQRSCQLFNHWFNIPPIERLDREMRAFDPNKLTTNDLKAAEQQLKKLWTRSHGILMKRVSGR